MRRAIWTYVRCLLTVVGLTLTYGGVAQSQEAPRREFIRVPSRAATRSGIDLTRQLEPAAPRLFGHDLPASVDRSRSKIIAGVASGLIPGLGSFYAAHPRHGITHLAIHVVAGTVALAGSVSCISALGGEADCNESGTQLFAVAWLVNWGWSIITAVNDAGAFNTAHSRP